MLLCCAVPVLCCAVLCLCCAVPVLCCAALCCAVLCCAVLCCVLSYIKLGSSRLALSVIISRSHFLATTNLKRTQGHVLGIGTLWEDRGCITGCSVSSPALNVYYQCTNARREYQSMPGCTGELPIETAAGQGSGCSHCEWLLVFWSSHHRSGELLHVPGEQRVAFKSRRGALFKTLIYYLLHCSPFRTAGKEEVLTSELMTPYATGSLALSRVTAGTIEDLVGGWVGGWVKGEWADTRCSFHVECTVSLHHKTSILLLNFAPPKLTCVTRTQMIDLAVRHRQR